MAPRSGERILVRANSPINTIHDLAGKTILVAKGSAAHANVLEHLADTGLKPKDVKLVFLQPADALSAFANGQGDAWVIWEPYTAQAELTLKVRNIGERRKRLLVRQRLRSGADRSETQLRAGRSAGAL